MKTWRCLAVGLFLVAGKGFAQSPPITADAVNLYAGPGYDYPPVVQLGPGYPLVIYGCVGGYTWCDVAYQYARGWIDGREISFPYQGEAVPVDLYGPTIGLPLIGFDINTYWGHWYRDRPWFDDRERFWRHEAPVDRWDGPRREWDAGRRERYEHFAQERGDNRGGGWHGGAGPGFRGGEGRSQGNSQFFQHDYRGPHGQWHGGGDQFQHEQQRPQQQFQQQQQQFHQQQFQQRQQQQFHQQQFQQERQQQFHQQQFQQERQQQQFHQQQFQHQPMQQQQFHQQQFQAEHGAPPGGFGHPGGGAPAGGAAQGPPPGGGVGGHGPPPGGGDDHHHH